MSQHTHISAVLNRQKECNPAKMKQEMHWYKLRKGGDLKPNSMDYILLISINEVNCHILKGSKCLKSKILFELNSLMFI